jgi:YD repeat-containing protein
MRILKPLFLCISIYAAFVGCSKKDDPVAPVCYPGTSTYVNGSFSDVETYTYTNNKVTSISASSSDGATNTNNYNYNSQGKLISTTYTYTSGSYTYSNNETLTYDTKGKIIQMTSPSSKMVFTYNSSDQLVKEDLYENNSSTYVLYNSYTYTYPSVNTKNYTARMSYDGSNALQSMITYVYDAKQNLQAVLFPDYPGPTNNVTQTSVQNSGSSNPPTIVNYIYTYNASGFPLTITEKNGSYTTTYNYANCK